MAEKNKYGLIGGKLGHSLSPRIHDLIFKYTGLEGEYKLYPLESDKVKDFILSLNTNGFSGINVTIPYKTDVIPYLNGITYEAKEIGAVNTILTSDNKTKGYNTDYFGVEKMLKLAGIDVKGKKVTVLGSGGAAQAVLAYLRDSECEEIMIVTLFKEQDTEKYPDFTVIDYSEINENHGYEVLINTTPVGMYPDIDNCVVGKGIIRGYSAVADVIYNPLKTKLLSIAEQAGAKTINGLYMLVAQAVKAQEIWNDIKIDDSIIDKIYEDIKGEFADG